MYSAQSTLIAILPYKSKVEWGLFRHIRNVKMTMKNNGEHEIHFLMLKNSSVRQISWQD